jgi:hypothetical protein
MKRNFKSMETNEFCRTALALSNNTLRPLVHYSIKILQRFQTMGYKNSRKTARNHDLNYLI